MKFILCGWSLLAADASTSDLVTQLASVPLLIFIVFTIRNLVISFSETDAMLSNQAALIEQVKQQSRLAERKLEIFKLSVANRRYQAAKH